MDESAHTDTGTSRARRVLCLSVLLIGNFSAFCCISLMGPFFPNEAAKKGASMNVVGFIFSCPQLVVFLTSPLFGALLSEVSLRFMCISGLLVFCSSMVLFGLLADSPPGWTFIGLCFATRVVEALGTASYVTSCFTFAVGLFPDRKPLIFALLETGIGVGYAVGPVVGSFLYEFGGFRMTFWTIGGCVFIVGFAILITLPHVRQETSPVSLRSMFLLLRSPLFSVGGLSLTCVCYVFNVWVPGYAQYLQQFGVRMSTIGLMFLVLPLTYTIISPIFGLVISTKVPVIPAILTSQLALSVAMLLYGPAPFLTFLPRALWLLILSTACMGVFNSSLYMGTIACMFTGVRELGMKDDSKTQGLVSGLVRSALSLGEFISPMIGGVLTDSFGFAWATTSGSVYCFMTFLVFLVYLYVRHRNKPSCITGAEGYIQLDKMESSKRTTFSAADSGS